MNTRLKCVLLDDEIPGLTYLKMLCEQITELEVVKTYNDPLKFLAEAPLLDFDLCILDIEMPRRDGVQVAQSLHGKMIIFTTAYREYAADAFELDAVDYVLVLKNHAPICVILPKLKIRDLNHVTRRCFFVTKAALPRLGTAAGRPHSMEF